MPRSTESEESLSEMARNNPDAMIAYIKSCSDVGRLTHAAEIAGMIIRDAKIHDPLIQLLKHPRPVVREGALYGLYHHISYSIVLDAVYRTSLNDECETIRSVAGSLLHGIL